MEQEDKDSGLNVGDIKLLPLHHRIELRFGAHPGSYRMGNGRSFPGNKATGA